MNNYTLEELRNDLDTIMKRVACGGEAISVQVTSKQKAILIDEAEWDMLCDGFALLIDLWNEKRIKEK